MHKKKTTKRIQPTVVIGLGGTGMNTIVRLKRRAVEEFGTPLETVCPQLRFLLLDTDDPEETLRSEQNVDYKNFNNRPEEFIKATAQDISPEKVRQEPSIQKWFPKEERLYSAINDFQKGARGIKALGRLAFTWNYERIKAKLPPLFNITFPVVYDSNGNVERGFSVYVVGSLGGGTGSGMFLDMGYLLNRLCDDGAIHYPLDVRGLFVMGELHAQKAGSRTMANTYASLKELNHYMRNDTKFVPHYKDDYSDSTTKKPYDLIYLFGNSNGNINFDDPSQLYDMLANFIFIDSSTLVAEHIWRYRVNKSQYTAVIDNNKTPFCYSSLGLCIVRFPWQHVLDLCAYRFAQKVIDEHFLKPNEIKRHNVNNYVHDFIQSKRLACDSESQNTDYDLSLRLISKEDENEISQISTIISKAFEATTGKIKDASPIKKLRSNLEKRTKETKDSIDDQVSFELSAAKNIISAEIKSIMQRDQQSGLKFSIKFCEILKQECTRAMSYARKELSDAREREDKLQKHLNYNANQFQNLFGGLTIFKKRAINDQFKSTLEAMKKVYLNELFVIKYDAAVKFFNNLLDRNGRMRNEGLISYITREINKLKSIEKVMIDLHQEMRQLFDKHKNINGSEFDQLVYDNKNLQDFYDVYDPIDHNPDILSDVAKKIVNASTKAFQDMDNLIQSDIGLPMKPFDEHEINIYREIFLEHCREVFIQEIDRYTVEQRIEKARDRNIMNYYEKMNVFYDISEHYALFDRGVTSFARFDDQQQSFFMIGLDDKDKSKLPAFFQENVGLRPGEETGNFITTRDKHQIVIFREIHGFPAYMLKTSNAYLNQYMAMSKNSKEPPLQMVPHDLINFQPPNEKVVFEYEKRAIEGLVFGTIHPDFDENHDLIYLLLTLDDRKRRIKAEQQKNQRQVFDSRDLSRGIPLDATYDRSVSDKIQRQTHEKSSKKYIELLIDEIEKVKKQVYDYQEKNKLGYDIVIELFQAYYNELPIQKMLDKDPSIDIDEIKRIIKKILWTDFRIDDLNYKPDKSYESLLNECLFS